MITASMTSGEMRRVRNLDETRIYEFQMRKANELKREMRKQNVRQITKTFELATPNADYLIVVGVKHGDESMENYMPSCRSCNLRKRDMSLEQFRSEITRQAKGLLIGKASFQVKMSLAYGLIEEHFDRQIEFYFEKFK